MEDVHSTGDWLSDLAMEDPASITQHCQMMMMMLNSQDNDDDNMMFSDPSDFFFQEQSSYSSSSGVNQTNKAMSHEISIGAAKKEAKAENSSMINTVWSSGTSSSCSPPSGQLISFGSSEDCDIKEEPVHHYRDHNGTTTNKNRRTYARSTTKPKTSKRPVSTMSACTQEHVLAERKRREIMTQRFLALSSLIPGLKKMDKASILGDAAKYLKELEEQVKVLEEQTTNRIVESVVIAKRSEDQSNTDDGNSYLDHEDDSNNNSNSLLEIEARASNKNVLIRIHSQKNQGLSQKVLNEIEKLHLTPLNYNTAPFGNYATNMTIIAQMGDEFSMEMKDLALNLRRRIQNFLGAP